MIFGGENKLKKALFELIEEGLALVFDNWKDPLIKGRQKKWVRPAAGQEAALTDQRILSSPL